MRMTQPDKPEAQLAPVEPAASRALATGRRLLDRVDLALVALMLALALPVVQPLGAQQASRLALTAAIWDDHSIWLDGYPLGVDQAEHDGHVVSDKSPGQPFLAVPAYAFYRMVGGAPARELDVEGNLGLWWVSLWTSAIPGAVLVLLVRRSTRHISERGAVFAAAAVGTSTLVLPFSTLLFSHVLATTLAFGAWHLLGPSPPPRRRVLVLAGALAGAAVVTEYTMALAAVALLVHATYAFRREVRWMIIGALPFALLLMTYQWAAFGHPFTLSYARSTFLEQTAGTAGRASLSILEVTGRVFFSDRGIVVATPVVLVGAIGMVVLIRETTGIRRSALLTAAAIATSVIALQCLWSNATGGDSPGPRYALAASAFLAPGLAVAWSRWRIACLASAAIGAAIMVSASYTNPIMSPDSSGVTGHWLTLLLRGEWGLTIYEMAFGSTASRVLVPIGALAAGLLLLRSTSGLPGSSHKDGMG
jgi:hypothetical protein